jgi:hypothetical protein
MSDGSNDAGQRRKPRPWSEADDAELLRMIEARQPPSEIAKQLDRTVDAIRGRAAQLRLVLPSALRPWRKTMGRTPMGPAQDRPDQDTETDDES